MSDGPLSPPAFILTGMLECSGHSAVERIPPLNTNHTTKTLATSERPRPPFTVHK